MSEVAVVTVVSGRHDHLRRQHEALARCHRPADRVVVVSMNDPEVPDVVAAGPLREVATLRAVEATPLGLPLARARNTGVRAALDSGADLVVMLDVDCLPSPQLLDRYEHASMGHAWGDLLCGPVSYLPPPAGRDGPTDEDLRDARPHPARPDPPDGVVERGGDHRLFWSLSFALTSPVWRRIGGFDEAYVGYGGEDTDFAQRAARAGVGLTWVGGAVAHHQWHPVSDPPVEHVADIVRNANLFRERWGWTPMEGWLTAFARQGLVVEEDDAWRVIGGATGSPHRSQR